MAEIGICPLCQKAEGITGEICPNSFCKEKGYHFIPEKEFLHYPPGTPLDPFLGIKIKNYIIIGEIGSGGMGKVYKALQKPLNREVALKLIHGFSMDREQVERFEREARAVAMMEHYNIVHLYDFGTDEDRGNLTFMVMEYIKNAIGLDDEIFNRLEKFKPWTLAEIDNVFSQILSALSDAHKVGIIHRDIKPGNVMLKNTTDNPLFVKILDFGLARAYENVSGMKSLTVTGKIIGTPLYMAPEQVIGQKIDCRADLYSVGVILLEIILGRAPFPEETPKAVIMKKMNVGYNPLTEKDCARIPSPLLEVLKKAIDNNPENRFKSADEMKVALKEAVLKISSFQNIQEVIFPICDDKTALLYARERSSQPEIAKQRTVTTLERFITSVRNRKVPLFILLPLAIVALISVLLLVISEGDNNTNIGANESNLKEIPEKNYIYLVTKITENYKNNLNNIKSQIENVMVRDIIKPIQFPSFQKPEEPQKKKIKTQKKKSVKKKKIEEF